MQKKQAILLKTPSRARLEANYIVSYRDLHGLDRGVRSFAERECLMAWTLMRVIAAPIPPQPFQVVRTSFATRSTLYLAKRLLHVRRDLNEVQALTAPIFRSAELSFVIATAVMLILLPRATTIQGRVMAAPIWMLDVREQIALGWMSLETERQLWVNLEVAHVRSSSEIANASVVSVPIKVYRTIAQLSAVTNRQKLSVGSPLG